MKKSLRDRLLKYIRNQYPNWIAKGELLRLVQENTNNLSDNAGRRLREMESGLLSNGKTCPKVIEKRPDGKSIDYRALPPKQTTQYTNSDGKIIIINKWE